ncbi:MAG: hypothetical protein ABSG53_07150 [Thermoguttaceae bacterium]|jgi:hypothetical protein
MTRKKIGAQVSLTENGSALGIGSPKTTHRSAVTNDVLGSRANGHTARGRRIRDLYRDLLIRLGDGPHDAITQADALEVAELTVACEDIRTELAGGEAGDVKARANLVNAVTRLQSTKDRARRGLLKGAPAKPRGKAAVEAGKAALERLRKQLGYVPQSGKAKNA